MSDVQSVAHHLLMDAQPTAASHQVLRCCCSVGHYGVLGQFGSAPWVLCHPSSLLRLRTPCFCLSTTLQQPKHQCSIIAVLTVIQIRHHATY